MKVGLKIVSANIACEGRRTGGGSGPYAAALVDPWECVEVSVPGACLGHPGDGVEFGVA